MFDIGGVELLVIAAVAILVVGPRELPAMLRGIGKVVRQAREMTSSVQRQFNDALKEAELDDVKKTIDDVRSLNPATKIRQTIAKEMKPLTDVGDSLKTSGQANSIGKPEPKPSATAPAETAKLGGNTAGDGSTLTPAKPRVNAAASAGVAAPLADTPAPAATAPPPAKAATKTAAQKPAKVAAKRSPKAATTGTTKAASKAGAKGATKQSAKKTGTDNGG
ncbi:MAG: Sec-independent protein translocase protein TatB [Hyphomicrobiales bacterium]